MSQLKHRWSVGHNHMAGITAGNWLRLLRDVRFDFDAVYLHRIAFISALSVYNSFWATIENLRFASRIKNATPKTPLFVLGHWRSGTTHLHNLLCQNRQHFSFCNTYQAVNPFTFLSTEGMNTRLFGWLLPDTRPMDNMRLAFEEPQEDELGLCLASLRSLYMGISFPRLESRYARFLRFENVEDVDRERFKEVLQWFVRKMSIKDDKQIVLKSPSHTARIRMLLEIWPDARFVHIHRNPYEVFLSSRKYHDTATWYTYLQKPDRSRIDEEILTRYTELFDGFFDGRDLIPEGNFHEMAFADLDRKPLQEIRRTYEALNLPGLQESEPDLVAYIESLKSYRKNRHPELPADLRATIARRWQRSFDTWEYAT